MSKNSLFNALGLYEKRIIFEYVKHTAANECASLSETEMYAIAKTAGVPVALTKVALNRICANNLLDCTFDDHSDEYWYVIHKDFYDEATALYGVEELEALQRRKSIPASDRFVALDHNLPALVEAKQAVESLSKAISSSNSLFANAEERIQVSEELNFLGLNFERGLLTESWDVWIKIRDACNITSHGYDEAKAKKVAAILVDFASEARGLFNALASRPAE